MHNYVHNPREFARNISYQVKATREAIQTADFFRVYESAQFSQQKYHRGEFAARGHD